MRIESISPMMYVDHTLPAASVPGTSATNNINTNGSTDDFNAILKQSLAKLSVQDSEKSKDSLASVLGYDEELISDLLGTSDGKQKLSQMAQNHLTDVVLSSESDSKTTREDSTEALMDSMHSQKYSETMTQELQSTFESLASIYNRTTANKFFND